MAHQQKAKYIWMETYKQFQVETMEPQMETAFPLTVSRMVSILFNQFLSSTIFILKVTCRPDAEQECLTECASLLHPVQKQCL